MICTFGDKTDVVWVTRYNLDIINAIDEKGEMKFMTNIVDIATELLPEKDREELKTGIKVYGKKELNKKIEDFE